MKRIALLLLAVALVATAGTPPKKRPARREPVPVRISPADRLAARREIDNRIAAINTGTENPQALASFYEALKQTQNGGPPVHILQFGDSHTASDDWVNAMRTALQSRYGDGGPGFVHAGRPFRGYRRYDALGNQSAGWKTEGVMALRGNEHQGLSGLSITAQTAGQTVTLKASGALLEIFYRQQPSGGAFDFEIDNGPAGTIETDGPAAPGVFSRALTPGPHQITLRTLSRAPVRLFGFTLDNTAGVTLETLGINGAQASAILGWNESEFAALAARRDPALVIVAYGTNEANSHLWTPAQYRADLTAVIARIRTAAPDASILLIGPPDCGNLRPLIHLTEVIDIQRELATRLNLAFWDWRLHMGGPGIVKRWVTAGLSQGDYIHLTGEGYRMIGNMIFAQLDLHEQTTQNH